MRSFFPVLHGPYGEDGVLQGFFELLDKPYVGPDFRSCALCMDKALSKILVEAAGVPTPPFIQFDHIDYEESCDALLDEIEKEISYPLYLKPLRLGSSIGVSKVDNRKEFYEAAQEAFRYDTKLMAEKACEGCRELEFAVLGNTSATIEVPPPGEAFSLETSYDYKGKYGANPIRKATVATLDEKTLKLGQQMAKQAYIACQCEGLARVDFFLDQAGVFWFLEIQPIPGLTKTSLYPRIWSNRLGDFATLLDRFVILALHKSRAKNKHMCFNV